MRRRSRADRRRALDAIPELDRRHGASEDARIYSQVHGNELQIFVQDPITSDNCNIARAALEKHLQAHPLPVVVLDLQKVAYIDTPGLSTVFDVKKDIAAQGRLMYLQNPSRCVLRMLNITRLNRVFPVRYTNTDGERIPMSQPIPAPGKTTG